MSWRWVLSLLAVVSLSVGLGAIAHAEDEAPASQPAANEAAADDGWGPRSTYGRLYNTETVETIAGTVEEVQHVPSRSGRRSAGVHLIVKTENETLPVHLGPAWYIARQQPRLAEGDTISVMGSRVTFEDKPAIIAAEVTKGDAVLKLRDENGYPVWAGWRRRGQ